jgi:predicted O-linked N-acetylglucosamine transferase (SPINDLY family)
LAPDEYNVLASAAAVATAALTTASTSLPGDALDGDMGSVRLDSIGRRRSSTADVSQQLQDSRPLNAQEQQEVAATLRAWAGLEGVTRQEQARQQLLTLTNSLTGTQYMPPDFARHFQSQLTALAAGYNHRLHADTLAQDLLPQRQTSTQAMLDYTIGSQASQEAIEGDQHDPLQLISHATSTSGMAVDSPQIRDQLLRLAHQLYATGGKQVQHTADEGHHENKTQSKVDDKASIQRKIPPSAQSARIELHPTLLPLLHTLHRLHPDHLPTLLLLSCAYYSTGDLAASLRYNKMILSIDPAYVESMSNIGTTLRALGRWHEAESWWWRAIRLRPGYWDAHENLLGVLCSPQQIPPSDEERVAAERVAQRGDLPADSMESSTKERQPETGQPRFKEALELCEFVEGNVLSKRQVDDGDRIRKVPAMASNGNETPFFVPTHLPVSQIPRLQNLYYAKGNLKYVLTELGTLPAAREYEKAVEIVISPSEDNAYSVRDLILAVYVVGIFTLGVSLPGQTSSLAAVEIAQAIGLDLSSPHHLQLVSTGQYSILCPGGGILRLVRSAGDTLTKILLRHGGGAQLPYLLLLPHACIKLASILFAESQGSLPALAEAGRRTNQTQESIQGILQQSQSMTSTILLTLTKLMQDASTRLIADCKGMLTLDGLPPSTSLLLPLYYLSITINQAASTANNLGILLSSVPVSANVTDSAGEQQHVNGQAMALQYYTYGLQLDAKHPHLYTNFGSLLKDLNHLPEAIKMYEKAIECNPFFDVALANLGNAIKDQGRTPESVQYYRRAVQVNPNFPEALCGLVNALLAICDWQDVYSEDDEGKSGLMKRIVELLDRQLNEGRSYGIGALTAADTPEGWTDFVVRTTGRKEAAYRDDWHEKFKRLVNLGIGEERETLSFNEGSFVLRLIERSMRRTQRRWYLDTYGTVASTDKPAKRIEVTASDEEIYRRRTLPACMGIPSVPSILPFHCFTLKISPRQIRLISHRTALRISQTTLSQPWMPTHVFPPPPPPSPRIRIAYISSDLNNHPLAHLMQSVFGMHDLSRFEVFIYATTPTDQSPYRKKIEREAEHFLDVSTWTNQAIISRALQDGIHIGVNLSGFTKGARNEIFAARPFPVSIHYMGFAGGLAATWNDYSVVDAIACPPSVTSADIWRNEQKKRTGREVALTDFDGDRDPEALDDDWVYPDRFIYTPDSYFVTDHRQGFREPDQRLDEDGAPLRPHEMSSEEAWQEEERKRWRARKEMWPSVPDDYLILADFNQLYKVEPTAFKLWLRILKRLPKSILWLLRFPAAGEAHLQRYAQQHFGDEVAARVIFTDVAPKDVHIHRGRIADLFLDTLECGAHTTSADILWSGTPVLTWPKHKHKMASRVAASIVAATGHGDTMIVDSEEAYEERAVALANSLRYTYVDQAGRELKPVVDESKVYADALFFNTSKSSARMHNNDKMTVDEGSQDAPAPANVKKAARETTRTDGQVIDPLSPRSSICLGQYGVRGPPETVFRRAKGELAELRRTLFLTRDVSRLFDTPRWVRHLEHGYQEAWHRWVQGIDMEESAEWHALPEDHAAKRSGHIWVQDEEQEGRRG